MVVQRVHLPGTELRKAEKAPRNPLQFFAVVERTRVSADLAHSAHAKATGRNIGKVPSRNLIELSINVGYKNGILTDTRALRHSCSPEPPCPGQVRAVRDGASWRYCPERR